MTAEARCTECRHYRGGYRYCRTGGKAGGGAWMRTCLGFEARWGWTPPAESLPRAPAQPDTPEPTPLPRCPPLMVAIPRRPAVKVAIPVFAPVTRVRLALDRAGMLGYVATIAAVGRHQVGIRLRLDAPPAVVEMVLNLIDQAVQTTKEPR
jgi:hypothetical protein